MNVSTSDSYVSKLFVEPTTASDSKQRLSISRKLFLRILAVCEWVADFSTCMALPLAAELLESHIGGPGIYPIHTMLSVSAIAGLFVAALLQQNRITSEWASLHPVHETAGAVRISLQALVLLLLGSVLLRPDLPLYAIALALVLMPLGLMLQKQVFTSIIQGLHTRGYCADRVVIYGAGEASWRITSALLSAPRLALRPVAFIDENFGSVDDCSSDLTYQESIEGAAQYTSVTLDLLTSLHCDLLLIATTSLSTKQRDRLKTIAKQAGVRVEQLSEAGLEEVHPANCIEVNGLFLARERKKASTGLYVYGKRIVDIIVSSVLLLLLSPAFLLIALLIRLNSHGPALFVQKRVGRDGAMFKMYKFRSMCYQARKYESSPKTSHDPRITRIGKFLRRTSLDELPQLINVFFGQMSLVGPRPEMPFIVRQYTEYQRQRLQIIPGITGLWQLSSDRAHPIHENLHHDLSYIQHRSLPMDIAILIHTVFFAMGGGV
jgi:exopolysaccharide biosynthesis polyprenyl glycosylphosphotransferase